MNFGTNKMSKLIRSATFAVAVLLPPDHASADSRVGDMSALEREKSIRESLFAPDNPQHAFAAAVAPPERTISPSRDQDNPTQNVAPERERISAPTQRGNGTSQYSSQRNYQYQRRDQIPQQQVQDPNAVSVDNNGGVHINTGNNGIDRSVEGFIDRKVRGAQNALRSLWR